MATRKKRRNEALDLSPEERARRIWNTRLIHSHRSNRMWRAFALVMTVITFAVVVLAWHNMSQPKLIPYVVELRENEQTGQVEASFRGIMERTPPSLTDDVSQYALRLFVRGLRVVTSDLVEQQLRFQDILFFTNRHSQIQLREYLQTPGETNPLSMSANEVRRDIRITAMVKHSERTWRVDWIEEVRQGGMLADVVSMTGSFSLGQVLMETEEEVVRNPYGVVIEEFFITERNQ